MLTQHTLQTALKDLGVQEGDTLLIHSNLMMLGSIEGAHQREEILAFYLQAFQNVLGSSGTVAVPAFFYEYARFGEPFDTKHSPVSKSLGAFSSYVTALPKTVRSCNPLQSIAALGSKAELIAGGDSLSGYGVNSPWHRLRQQKAKILFIGIGVETMTYVHYIEQAVGVPHMYWKLYATPVLRDGIPLAGHPVSAVRYLNYEIEYCLKPFEELLLKQGIANSLSVGKGQILVVDAEQAYQLGIQCLEKNIYYFLKKPPKFIPGQIPFDGITSR